VSVDHVVAEFRLKHCEINRPVIKNSKSVSLVPTVILCKLVLSKRNLRCKAGDSLEDMSQLQLKGHMLVYRSVESSSPNEIIGRLLSMYQEMQPALNRSHRTSLHFR